METRTFKERVRLDMMKSAIDFKKVYIDYEYLICSEAFIRNKYYIINAREDNFQHLTGVHSELKPLIFFEKCYNGTLLESDFDFSKPGQNEKAVKGTVRRKINLLLNISTFFYGNMQAEEDFKKNTILCSFATTNGDCTLGFSVSKKVRPKTLLKGNELANPKPVDLILRRKTGELFFDEIIVGNRIMLQKYIFYIDNILRDSLLKK